MTSIEIIQSIANSHNRLMQITVSGDDAIRMGNTLKDLRILIQGLQEDITAQEGESLIGEEEDKSECS